MYLAKFLSSPGFWISICLPLAFTVVVAGISAVLWRGLFADPDEQSNAPKPKSRSLNSEAFRQPMSSGITTAGLALTLVASLITYLVGKLNVPLESINPLLASGAVLTFSILVGIFNLYSLATETDEKGVITVTKERLSYLPAVFITQLALIFSGICLILWYCLFFSKLPQAAAEPTTTLQNAGGAPLHASDYLGTDWAVAEAHLGPPKTQMKDGSELKFVYETSKSTYNVFVHEGIVIKIVEQVKENHWNGH